MFGSSRLNTIMKIGSTISTRSSRKFLFTLACTCLNLGCSVTTFAYEEDTHFLMTYVLCRAVGFTDEEALIIASVDQGMDDSPAVNAHNKAVPHTLEEWLWHALDKDGEMTAKGILARRDELFQDALEEQDPHKRLIRLGVFFHYQQDSWAHRHHDKSNHLSPTDFTTFNTPAGHAAFGGKPDRPPLDPVAALMCLEDGIVYAADILKRGFGREPNRHFAGYAPKGGKVDKSWKDKRRAKYFNQIERSAAPDFTAHKFLLEMLAAQIDSYTASRDANPNYFGRATPDEVEIRKVRAALQRAWDGFVPAVEPTVIPSEEQKIGQKFQAMSTAGILGMDNVTVIVTQANVDTALKRGDLMFKYVDFDNKSGLPKAGVAFEGLIQAGQQAMRMSSKVWNKFLDSENSDFRRALAKGDSNGVHMAIYIGGGQLAEAYGTSLNGASVTRWGLFDAHDHQTWFVLRPKDARFADAMAEVAARWATGRMKYLVPLQAIVTSSSFGSNAKRQALTFFEAYDTAGGPPSIDKMFCSQFAVAVAQSAAIKVYLASAGRNVTAELLDSLPDEVKLDAFSSPSTFYGVLEKSPNIESIGPVFIESAK